MKRAKYLILFLFLFAFSKSNAYTEVSFNFFYHSLEPHGEWIEVDNEVYAWRPYDVSRSWQPYTDGRWSYTEHGWYWESYEPFGWATYHYGRWYYDDFEGWLWLPGYTWGPAWVEWRNNDNYIGWAPLPPYASFRVNVGIHFSVRWRSNYHHWHFVRYNNFCSPGVNVYFVHRSKKNFIFNNTKYRTNYYYDRGRVVNRGVERSYVERRGGYRVSERNLVVVNDNSKRSYKSRSGNIEVYKPSTRDVNSYSNRGNVKVRKTERSTTLRTDKVVVGKRSRTVTKSNSREVRTNKSVDRKNYSSSREVNKSRNYSVDRNKTNKSSKRSSVNNSSRNYNSDSRTTKKKTTNNYSTKRKSVTKRTYNKNDSGVSKRSTTKRKSTSSYNKTNSSKRNTTKSYNRSSKNKSSRKTYIKKSNTSSRKATTKKSSSGSRSKSSNSKSKSRR